MEDIEVEDVDMDLSGVLSMSGKYRSSLSREDRGRIGYGIRMQSKIDMYELDGREKLSKKYSQSARSRWRENDDCLIYDHCRYSRVVAEAEDLDAKVGGRPIRTCGCPPDLRRYVRTRNSCAGFGGTIEKTICLACRSQLAYRAVEETWSL